MNAARRAFRKAVAMIFPWPAKHERQAAIAAARREREHSQAEAKRAETIKRQLRQMAADNHFAENIAQQIARGHG